MLRSGSVGTSVVLQLVVFKCSLRLQRNTSTTRLRHLRSIYQCALRNSKQAGQNDFFASFATFPFGESPRDCALARQRKEPKKTNNARARQTQKAAAKNIEYSSAALCFYILYIEEWMVSLLSSTLSLSYVSLSLSLSHHSILCRGD